MSVAEPTFGAGGAEPYASALLGAELELVLAGSAR